MPSCAQVKGVSHLLPRESWILEAARLAFLFSSFFSFFLMHTSAAICNLRSFPVTSWQPFALRAPRPFSDGNIRQGFPSCRIPTIQPRCHPAHPKQASRFKGFPTRAHVLCSSVTCAAESPMTSLAPRNRATSCASRGTHNASGRQLRALCEQNAWRRPHGALHARSPGKPVRSKFIFPA